ncbi:MAG: fibronectin type III domain-containing protein [Eubacterium sp.]|nr:fibronectin type III domain-containing protein [Eubacterium sp.]
MSKKILTMILIGAMILNVNFSMKGVNAQEKEEYVINNFTYQLDEKGVIIKKYTGTEEEVTVPEKIDGKTVYKIGTMAFVDNKTIKKVHLPESMEILGTDSFACSTVEEINFPSSLKEIDGAFGGCKELTEITIPKSLERVSGYPFSDSGLKKVIFEDGCTDVFPNMLIWTYNLEQVVLPDTIEFIGTSAFSESGIKEIKLPKNIKKLGTGAFKECNNLKEVFIPTGVETTGCPFWGSGLKKVEFEDGMKKIPDDILRGAKKIEKITMPDSVTEIGENAFAWCEKLTEVQFSKNLTYIGPNAFAGNLSLEHIELPDSLRSMNREVFSGDIKLKEIFIPKGVTELFCTFYESCVEKVVFEDGMEYVPSDAFERAEYLKNVVFPKSVKSIEGSAFNGCKSLVNIQLPSDLQRINYSAFKNCTGITSISIPDKVKVIESNAFESCKNLTDVKLPKYLEEIGEEAFHFCNLNEIVIPKKVKKIRRAFWCSGIKKIVFEEGITEIPEYTIGSFGAETLTEIVLPESVTKIGRYAFDGCKNIKNVYWSTNIKEIGEDAFDRELSGATAYVLKLGEASSLAQLKGFKVVVYEPQTEKEEFSTTVPKQEIQKVENKKKIKIARASIKKIKNKKGRIIRLVINKAKNAKGYLIQYSTDRKFKKKKSIYTQKLNCKIRNLKKGKKYWIRVRGINGSKKGKWSNAKKVLIQY